MVSKAERNMMKKHNSAMAKKMADRIPSNFPMPRKTPKK